MSIQKKTPDQNPANPYARTFFRLTCHRSLLMQGLGWLGALGLLSSGVMWTPRQVSAYEQDPTLDPISYDAIGETEWVEPAYQEPAYQEPVYQEPVYQEPAYQEPVYQEPAYQEPVYQEPTAYEPEWTPEPTAYEPEWTPEPTAYEPEWTPEPTAYEPDPIDDSSVPVVLEQAPVSYSAEDLMPVGTDVAETGSGYIDASADFDTGATSTTYENYENYQEPAQVVISERSTGCEAVVNNGQMVNTVCGGSAPAYVAPETAPATASARQAQPASEPIPAWTPDNYQPAAQPAPPRSPANQGYASNSPTNSPAPGVGGTTASGRSYFNSRKPTGLPGNGNARLLYPLAIPAQITSHFGWRMHPIHGEWRMHSGTDMAAATGTHVLAALGGRVAIANFLGGYGLTVVLEHNNGTQETLYAHLSEIFVQPGDKIDQGTVIGSVGSTGHSTGPHLHFEMREQTEDGWVAVDAGAQLEYALARLIQSWETASATPYTGGNAKELQKFPAPELSVEELPYVSVRPM